MHHTQIEQNASYGIRTYHIYIYRQFSAFIISVGLAKARPNEKSTVRLASEGPAQARPNFWGIPPRYREAVMIAIGHDGDCYAQFKVAQYPGFLRLTNLEIHVGRLFAFLIC